MNGLSQRKKHLAHVKVDYALKHGRLTRPDACEKCGTCPSPGVDGRASIQGHHHRGYDAPLDVQWLCVRCHKLSEISYQSLKTHCPRGHEYSPENTYFGRLRGERRCRECARELDRRRSKTRVRR